MNYELSYFKIDDDILEIVDQKCREDLSHVATPEVIEGINQRIDGVENDFENLPTSAKTGSYNDLIDKPSLARVATSGNYNDLTNKPNLANVATSGSYNDLANRPNLATVATTGKYTDLLNRPNLASVATSGSYNDLTDKPTIPVMPSLATVATTGNYSDLTNKPTIPTNTNQLVNGAGFITTSEREAIISAPFILTKIPTTDGVKYKLDASFVYHLAITTLYGSGYLCDITIPIPAAVRPPISFYDVQLTAQASGQIVVCAISNITASEITGWVWSPVQMTNDINIQFSAYGF